MNKLLTYFYCTSLLCCVEVNAMENPPIPYIPKFLMKHILSFVQEDDNKNLRLVSKGMKENVEIVFQESSNRQFGNYTVKRMPFLINNLLADSPEFSFPPLTYTRRIMKEVCTKYLQEDFYLFVPQGCLLERYLDRNYKSLLLYIYLKNKKEETKDLFKAFFGKDLPEGKELLGLKLLTACLPANHIYVHKATPESFYSELMKHFQKRLLQSIQGDKRKYFLCGIDDPSTLSGKDVIVINQSDWCLESFSYLDNSSVDRTIIYNADQRELSFSNPPKCMSKLILVNGDNCCEIIEKNFLAKNQNLQSCAFKGLKKVNEIRDNFLKECKNLVTFDTKGMTSVRTIGDRFLYECSNLVTFDTKGMTSVFTIGDWFLARCYNLVTFDTKGMTNIEIIKDSFLYFCKNLVTFDGKGMRKVKKIKRNFLSCCYNLVTFDTNGMANVETIESNFLDGCDNLVTFDSKGMKYIQTIGSYFLHKCKNLVTFDSKGMKYVYTIEDYFLDGCPKLNGDKIKEEILKKKF